MNMLKSSKSKARLRILGIVAAIVTIAVEGTIAIIVFALNWRSPTYTTGSWSVSIYFLLGALVGLLSLIVWLGYQPHSSNQSNDAKQQVSFASPSKGSFMNEPTSPSWLARSLDMASNGPDTIEYPPQNIKERSSNDIVGNGGRATEKVERGKVILSSPIIRAYTEYTVPKEGLVTELSQDKFKELSQDKYNKNRENEARYSYAVADGVGGSFLPSMWAEFVVKRFIELSEDFTTPQKFNKWLLVCKEDWYHWVDTDWIPTTKKIRGTNADWSGYRARGAETTFIGCSYSQIALAETGFTNIRVTAIGDSVFFLVRPPSEQDQRLSWQHWAYAIENPDDFGPTPYTLATASTDISRVWERVNQKVYQAYPGDYIFLTTDALAKWVLQQKNVPWETLLSLTDFNSFFEFVRKERLEGALDLDDTTMMVVPL